MALISLFIVNVYNRFQDWLHKPAYQVMDIPWIERQKIKNLPH